MRAEEYVDSILERLSVRWSEDVLPDSAHGTPELRIRAGFVSAIQLAESRSTQRPAVRCGRRSAEGPTSIIIE